MHQFKTARINHSVRLGADGKELEKKIEAAHAYLYQTRNPAYLKMNAPVQKLTQSR